MKIDLGTIALILVLSNAIQAIFIYFQSTVNKKFEGIKEYAAGSVLYSLGFLFVMFKGIAGFSIYAIIIGNAFIVLAVMFHYTGLMRFIRIRVFYKFISLLFIVCLFFLSFYSFNDNINARIIVISGTLSSLSFIIALGLLGKNKSAVTYPTRFLGFIYLTTGVLSAINSYSAIVSDDLTDFLSPYLIQVLSLASFFIVTLFTTFGFISIINLRLMSDINESKEQFEQIFNLSPDAALITTFDEGRIVNFNQGFLEYSGYRAEEITGKSLQELGIYEDQLKRQTMLKVLKEKGSLQNVETNFIRKNGSRIVCIISYEKIILNNTPHIISIAHDITEMKESEEDLKTSEEKYRFLTEFASDVTWVYNYTRNKYTYFSPSVYELRGLTAEEAVTQTFEESFSKDSLPLILDTITRNLEKAVSNDNSGESYISEVQQPCKNGELIWTELSTKYFTNDEGEIEVIGVSRNIERRKKFEKQVVYLSYHDQVTGLYNRRFYDEELSRLDNGQNLPLALIMADVNGLKLMNDAFGHATGDILLEKVANIFKNECCNNETVSRVGGDEFVVLMPRTNKEAAKSFIKKIKEALLNEKIFDVAVSVSLGLAIKQEMYEDINKIYNKAEDDMYRNKLAERTIIRNQTISIIMNSLYKKNNVEKPHSKSVEGLCERIAVALGLDKDAVNEVRIAGLMHDIGKIGISDILINKTQKLSDAEFNEIKRHAEAGYRILSSSSEFSNIAEYILEHHEKWDGSGYPRGLKGEEISLQGRIIAIADAYDVIKSERAYCQDLSDSEAISEIRKCAGTHFDPEIARVFVENVMGRPW